MGETMFTSPAPGVTIRYARPEDGPAVQTFVFATLRSYGIEPDPEGLDADVVHFGESGDGEIAELVLDSGGMAVGSVALTPKGEGVAHLSKFFINAAQRGKGLGRPLLAAAVAEARRRGYHRLQLETRTAYEQAVHLYESTGWQRGPDLPPGHGPDRSYFLHLR